MNFNVEKNKYRIVLLAAQRAKQLNNGAQQRVKVTGEKMTKVALNEIKEGLIGYELLPIKTV